MRWLRREGPLPQHPYRDSAIVYGVMAAVIVGMTAVTGGGLARGVVVAGAFFVLATGWSWWRFRERVQGRERR
jgi:hypothetical protein